MHHAAVSHARRWHDALKLVLPATLDSAALGQRDKAAPHLDVTTSLAALNNDPGARPATGATGASGARLPLSLVKQWSCDAHITGYVLGPGHRVLAVSYTERTLKAHERRVKKLQTAGVCQGAGCRRGPGHPLTPHHVDPWATTGRTSLCDSAAVRADPQPAPPRPDHHPARRRRLNENGWVS